MSGGCCFVGPVLWMPFAIVCAQGSLRFDVYDHFRTGRIVTNFAVSLALVPLMHWMAQRFDARADRAGFMQASPTMWPGEAWRRPTGSSTRSH